MRCEKSKRWISDELDGALGDARRSALAAHLGDCGDCRAYRDSLRRLQTASRAVAPSAPEAEKMVQSIGRLKAKLHRAEADGVKPGFGRIHAPAPSAGPRLAWAGASAFLVAAFGFYLFFLRPSAVFETVPYSFSEVQSNLDLSLAADDDLAGAFDGEIRSSLLGAAKPASSEILTMDSGRFLESLTEEEVVLLDAAVRKLITT